jgi:hypothetical protein
MVNERWAVRSVARGDPGDVHTASGVFHKGGRAGAGSLALALVQVQVQATEVQL